VKPELFWIIGDILLIVIAIYLLVKLFKKPKNESKDSKYY